MLAGLALPALMAALDTSIANAALPLLAAAFHASFAQVQWILLAYLLALTTLVVSVGRLGDLVGKRRLLLIGILVFTLASLLCGIAPTLGLLIAARAAQGVGAAIMMALTLAMVAETVPAEATARTMGLLGTMSAIGTAIGPSLGGLLSAALGWRAIFLINAPLGALSFVLALQHLPVDRPRADRARQRFDSVGTALLAATLGAYALAMTHRQPALLAAAAIGLGVFLLVESRSASPLIPLNAFRHPTLSAGLATGALVATVMMSTLVVGPFYLSRTLGLDPIATGLVLSIGPLVVALSGVPAGRAADRFGAVRVMRAGLIAIATGSLALWAAPTSLGLSGYVAPLVILTAGYALFQTGNNTTLMAEQPPEQRGMTSGLIHLSRNLGLITGASMMGGVFALAAGTGHLADASPAAVATGMRVTFGVAAALMLIAITIAAAARSLPFSPRLSHHAAPQDTPPDAAACLTLERK